MGRIWTVVACVFVVRSLQAAMLAGWEIEGVDVDNGIGLDAPGAPYRFSATTGELAAVSAVLTLGDGTTPSTAASQYGFKIALANQQTNLVGAIEHNHYIEFSLTPTAGYILNLSSIEMRGDATSSGCADLALLSSVDGYVDGCEIAVATNVNGNVFDTDKGSWGGPIDLGAERYQNLTGLVAFRIYGWNSSSGSGVTRLRTLTGPDLKVNGTFGIDPAAQVPTLAVGISNGMASVAASFTLQGGPGYVLQHNTGLEGYNGWQKLTDPFSSNAVFEIELTNNAGFFRAVPN